MEAETRLYVRRAGEPFEARQVTAENLGEIADWIDDSLTWIPRVEPKGGFEWTSRGQIRRIPVGYVTDENHPVYLTDYILNGRDVMPDAGFQSTFKVWPDSRRCPECGWIPCGCNGRKSSSGDGKLSDDHV